MSVSVLPVAHGAIGVPPHSLPALIERSHSIETRASNFLSPWEASHFPTACIDGRPTPGEAPDTSFTPALRLAGGSVSVWAGMVLAGALPLPASDEACVASLRDFCKDLHEQGFTLATHTDDHAQGENCGCGAVDHLESIVRLISSERHTITEIVNAWGFDLPDTAIDTLGATADFLAAVATGLGRCFNQTIRSISPTANAHVQGAHQEILAVINTQTGTAVKRAAVMSEVRVGCLVEVDDPKLSSLTYGRCQGSPRH